MTRRIPKARKIQAVAGGNDLLIFDGYARLHALRQLGIDKCLAYVGRA